MTPSTLSPLRLFLFIIVGALLIKIYQHNKLMYLTYAHQKLSREQAELEYECMRLTEKYHKINDLQKISAALQHQGFTALTAPQLVSLTSVKQGTPHAL